MRWSRPAALLYAAMTVAAVAVAAGAVSTTELAALRDLYTAGHGTSWSTFSGWLLLTSPCTASGVTCNTANQIRWGRALTVPVVALGPGHFVTCASIPSIVFPVSSTWEVSAWLEQSRPLSRT